MSQFRLFVPWQKRIRTSYRHPCLFPWQRDAFVIAHTFRWSLRARARDAAGHPLARLMARVVARSTDLEGLALSEVVYERLLVEATLDVAFEVRARRERGRRCPRDG